MKILILVAGTNEPSNSNVLADAFAEGARSVSGIEVEKIRLKDLTIDHFTVENYKKTCVSDDDFCDLQEKIEAAKGIAIASPIWNFSVPAHLKNLIDRMGAFALDEETHSQGQFGGKPFTFLFTGGVPVIAWKALMYVTTLHVSEAMKYYGATITGRSFEPRCQPAKGKFGLVVDKRPDSLAKARRNGVRFAKLTKLFSETGKLPLRIRLISSFFTWAYRVGNRILYPVSMQQ
ncbi:NAD(P)H-dependent oxidoreductase [Candidatus Peregrinibacteria bacterium]|nr:NAD(P)H-dependent oxidoreductase [Candidatus Peregrinibacteria bacterium]